MLKSTILSLLSIAGIGAADIQIDGGQRYQTITGFGAELYNYDPLPYDISTVPKLFVRDLGGSIARIAVMPELLSQEPKDLAGWLAAPLDDTVATLNFAQPAMAKVGRLIKPMVEARLDVFRVIATVWSPPGWMKTNGKPTHGGSLRADRRIFFAKYLAAFCKGYEKAYGAPIFALSIQNELFFNEPYDSCFYNPNSNQYHDAAIEVTRAFKKYGIATKLFGPENMVNDARGGFFYKMNMQYISPIAKDPEAAAGFIAWAFHGYAADGATVASSRKGWADYDQDLKATGKEIWMSETSGSAPAWIHATKGRADGAMSMSELIHDALVGNVNAWVYWGFMDGKATSVYNLRSHEDADSKKFACVKQWYRYIRPGAVRISATPDLGTLPIAAFIDEGRAGGKDAGITIVVSNPSLAEVPLTLALTHLPMPPTLAVIRTSAQESDSMQPIVHVHAGTAALAIPAQSVVTLTSLAVGDEAVSGKKTPE